MTLYRKPKNRNTAEPMPKRQFQRICKALKKRGIVVWTGSDADRICALQKCEGFTLNENTVVFAKNPSRSVVYEELIHLWQYGTNKCDGSTVSRIKCEVEAKEKVLKYAKAYKLTKLDVDLTKKALDRDYMNLRAYYEGGI